MYEKPKQLAIIGATASGKSALAVRIAKKLDANILSLDSLALYKQIDIASAKPTKKEMGGITHYGIDLIYPNEPFDVTIYAKLYQKVYAQTKAQNRTLIIVGGTSFYLKTLLEGISQIPKLSEKEKNQVDLYLKDHQKAYDMLLQIDSQYMSKIASSDRYRIEKALCIYTATKMPPSLYFEQNPPKPVITETLPIYEIIMDKTLLAERIEKRTAEMIKNGLIDEIAFLKKKYGTEPNCMKAIGIKETLEFLEDKIDEKKLVELISIHTRQLAKRQNTFNKTQFKEKISGNSEMIFEDILSHFVR